MTLKPGTSSTSVPSGSSHIGGLIKKAMFLSPKKRVSIYSQGECSLDPLKKLVVEIIAFLSTLGSLETDSG